MDDLARDRATDPGAGSATGKAAIGRLAAPEKAGMKLDATGAQQLLHARAESQQQVRKIAGGGRHGLPRPGWRGAAKDAVAIKRAERILTLVRQSKKDRSFAAMSGGTAIELKVPSPCSRQHTAVISPVATWRPAQLKANS